MENILARPWRHWLDFRGRSSRREYWLFYLQGILVVIAYELLVGLANNATGSTILAGGAAIAGLLLFLFLIVAHLAAAVRRLHDHDKTGWLWLLVLVPLLGWIFYLIMMLTPGTKGENSYGYDPREGDRPSLDEMHGVFS